MPASRRPAPPQPTPEELARQQARIVTGPEAERFYCPHPGCNRSFAELWRLKVHYRAPPDVRGSGKERGHGTELSFCPKCGKDLHPGKHHVGCVAGKSAPRQAAKRQRQILQGSTTTEEGTRTSATTSAGTSSLQQAFRRQQDVATKLPRTSEDQSSVHNRPMGSDPCKLEERQRSYEQGGNVSGPGRQQALAGFVPTYADVAAPPAGTVQLQGWPQQQQTAQQQQQQQQQTGISGKGLPPMGPQQQQQPPLQQQQQPSQPLPKQEVMADARPVSPGLGDLFLPHTQLPSSSDLLLRVPSPGLPAMAVESVPRPLSPLAGMMRPPSPPPLPPEWAGGGGSGLLFDFDQFDINKRREYEIGVSAPLVTVTSAMHPQELHNPSDDYIWQILFAGENDPVPKRVTAHLHHPPEMDDIFLPMEDEPQLQGWGDAGAAGAVLQPGSMQPPPPRLPVLAMPPPIGSTLLDDLLIDLKPTSLQELVERDAALAEAAGAAAPHGGGANGIKAEEDGLGVRAGAAAPLSTKAAGGPGALAKAEGGPEGPAGYGHNGVPNGSYPPVGMKVEGGTSAAGPPLMAAHAPQAAQTVAQGN